jgi:hypothetical protein
MKSTLYSYKDRATRCHGAAPYILEEIMAEDKVVAKFKRNPTEEVRAGIKEFKGRRYIDVRIYYQDDKQEWKPTRKGISLATDFMPELKQAVLAIEKELQESEQG